MVGIKWAAEPCWAMLKPPRLCWKLNLLGASNTWIFQSNWAAAQQVSGTALWRRPKSTEEFQVWGIKGWPNMRNTSWSQVPYAVLIQDDAVGCRRSFSFFFEIGSRKKLPNCERFRLQKLGHPLLGISWPTTTPLRCSVVLKRRSYSNSWVSCTLKWSSIRWLVVVCNLTCF